jgi:hypothetical protein
VDGVERGEWVLLTGTGIPGCSGRRWGRYIRCWLGRRSSRTAAPWRRIRPSALGSAHGTCPSRTGRL